MMTVKTKHKCDIPTFIMHIKFLTYPDIDFEESDLALHVGEQPYPDKPLNIEDPYRRLKQKIIKSSL